MDPSTSLENLHDLSLPPAVAWLPPAPGWYAVALILFLLASWLVWRWFRLRKINLYRRQALLELARLEKGVRANDTVDAAILRGLPALLKRAALAAYGREAAASLAGAPWLAFLDETCGRPLFSGEVGRLLLTCSYAPAGKLRSLSTKEAVSLCQAIGAWLHEHRLPEKQTA